MNNLQHIDNTLQKINSTTCDKKLQKLRKKLNTYIEAEINFRKRSDVFNTKESFYEYIRKTF